MQACNKHINYSGCLCIGVSGTEKLPYTVPAKENGGLHTMVLKNNEVIRWEYAWVTVRDCKDM